MITKADFINRVLLIMNEAGMMDAQNNSFIGADNTQIDRHIEGAYLDAWRRCIKVMPRMWFGNKVMPTGTNILIPDTGNGTGYVILPDDFYLLTSFKMAGWYKSVHELAIENERTSSIQSNDYTRGSELRPVCSMSVKIISNEIKNVLNYYSLKKGLTAHTVAEAIYVPVATSLKELANTSELDLSDQVLEPMAYITASTVFTMFEKYEIAKALEQRAIEMFPGLQSIKGTTVTIKQ